MVDGPAWTTEARMVASGLQLSRAVIPDVPVRVLNPKQEEIQAGDVITDLEGRDLPRPLLRDGHPRGFQRSSRHASWPCRQDLRRDPPAHQSAISQHVKNMIEQQVIEPNRSPWAANVVLVRKADSTLRCCIDYRNVNRVT